MLRNASESVVRVSEKNPHYFSYKGKELLLVTSAEHYGAVMHSKFDYKQYLDTLAKFNINYTRIYPGISVLSENRNRKNDTSGPGPALITPWARSDVPGYVNGGNKFDLNTWDEAFFERLHDFMKYAAEKDVIVELCFINSQHEHSYINSPLHKDSNIQNVGVDNYQDFETLKDYKLVYEQKKYIEKLVMETNQYDNLIYEFCDEPTLDGTKASEAKAWLDHLIDFVIEVEDKLPKKHMLAQQMMLGIDYSDDDRVAIIVSQYVTVNGRQIGGLPALNGCYASGKPIEMNETVSCLSDPVYYEGDVVDASRIESWEFMIGGGAAFNQINACFTALNPSGDDPVNHRILNQLKNLRGLVEGMDFAKMKRDKSTIKTLSVGGSANGISEPGKQYLFYLHHSFTNYQRWHPTHYVPIPGSYDTKIAINIPEGEYLLEFINPEDAKVISSQKITSKGDNLDIQCPNYKLDIVFRITR